MMIANLIGMTSTVFVVLATRAAEPERRAGHFAWSQSSN